MFSALGTRITGKQLDEFQGLFGNKFKDWMGQTYDVSKQIFNTFL